MRFSFYILFCLTILLENAGAQQAATAGNAIKHSFSKGFVENKGQIHDQADQPNPSVLYLLNRSGMNIQLRKNGFSYDTYVMKSIVHSPESLVSEHKPRDYGLKTKDSLLTTSYEFQRVDIELINSNPNVQLNPEEPLPGYFNYFIGSTEKGVTNVHHYKTVTYKNIYKNIDLVFTLDQNNKPEYNFVVHPGGKVSDIQMEYKGMDNIQQTEKTELSLKVTHGIFTDAIPLSYELENKKNIDVVYALNKDNKVSFTSPGYNSDNTLIIDPVPTLLWGTYFGGSVDDYSNSIAVDTNNGNIVITGSTTSPAIATVGAYHVSYVAAQDAYTAKFSPEGTQLLWATYYGGSGLDQGQSVAVDRNSNVLITGFTNSNNLPTTPGAHQTTFAGGNYDVFVAKFSSDGTTLVWGTYYGGGYGDRGFGVTTDANNNVFVTGGSNGTGMGTAGAWQQNYAGGAPGALHNGFVAEFNPATGALTWGSYFAGSGDTESNGITLDGAGNPLITGETDSQNAIATVGAYQSVYLGGCSIPTPAIANAFVAKFSADGTQLKWGTYYGGGVGSPCNVFANANDGEEAYGITTDASGNVLITGFASNNDHVATPGAYQTSLAGGVPGNKDAFVAKFNSSGTQLICATYYGGNGTDDQATGIAVDKSGNILISGYTNTSAGTPGFIIATPASQQSFYGSLSSGVPLDAFVAKFNSNCTQLLWGTYYGGGGADYGQGIALDSNGNALVTGYTTSTNLISTAGTYQPVLDGTGTNDAFIAKFEDTCKTTTSVNGINKPCLGGSTTFTASATNGTLFYSYTWLPSSGLNTTTGAVVIANPTITTNYTMTVTDASRCTVTIGLTVTVNSIPSLIVTSSTTICQGSGQTLSVTGADSYLWIPAASLSSPTFSVGTASPTVSTTYTVIGTDIGGCSDTLSTSVGVYVSPTVSLSSNTTICAGSTADLSAAGAISYTWLPSASLSSSTGTSVTASPTASITYTLTGTGANGCNSGGTVEIVVNPLPTFLVSPNITICSGSTAAISATGTVNYTWSPASGLSSSTGNLLIAAPSVTTTYSITGTDVNGCNSGAGIEVTVNPLPALLVPQNVTVCAGNTTTISATGAVNYTWSPASGLSSVTGSSVIAAPLNTATYTIVGTDANGCSDSVAITIDVSPNTLIAINITPANATICSGTSTLLSASVVTSQPPVVYLWNPFTGISSNTNSTVTADPLLTTSYTVTGTDANGCTNTVGVEVTVNPLQTVSVGNNVTITFGTSTTLSVTPAGGSFSWTPADGLSCNTCSGPVVSPTATVLYYVTRTDNNGCMATDSIQVTVLPLCNGVFVPDAFSPNGDGQNDVLLVKTTDVTCIQSFLFRIFDRWGNKVFETLNIQTGWDGKYHGKELDDAVFVYELTVTDLDNNTLAKKGNISLVK